MLELWRAITAYAEADDPRLAAANRLALLVASNQPFYPLYIRALVGDDGWTSTLTFLSTPFFLAVPYVGRRWPIIARMMLPLVGAANSFLAAKAFGAASGAELFLCPCAIIAALAFGRGERRPMLAVVGALLAMLLIFHDRLGAPLHFFSAEQYSALLNLNLWSAAGLSALVAWQFSSES